MRDPSSQPTVHRFSALSHPQLVRYSFVKALCLTIQMLKVSFGDVHSSKRLSFTISVILSVPVSPTVT